VNALRLRIKLTAWLALVALLALALMPTLARAVSRAQGGQGHGVEFCTQHGLERVALQGAVAAEAAADTGAAADVDGDVDGAMVQASGDLEHCPDCSLASHVLAPPPAHTPLALACGADYVAPLFLHAPRTLFAWRGPQSRAPPLTA